MNSGDLNFVNSDVNLETVKPIDRPTTVRMMNEFLLRMSDVLNDFASRVETRLIRVESQLDFVHTQILLLEKKLENINETVKDAEKPIESVPSTSLDSQLEEGHQEEYQKHKEDEQQIAVIVNNEATSDSAMTESENNGVLLKDHPRYSKYFKMMRIGISEMAVKQKMSIDGLDPTALNRPNERISFEANRTRSRSSSSSSSSSTAGGFSSSS